MKHVSASQACNQLGTPGGAKSFVSGAQIFWTVSDSLKLCSTHFSKGAKIFRGGLLLPWTSLVTGLALHTSMCVQYLLACVYLLHIWLDQQISHLCHSGKQQATSAAGCWYFMEKYYTACLVKIFKKFTFSSISTQNLQMMFKDHWCLEQKHILYISKQ